MRFLAGLITGAVLMFVLGLVLMMMFSPTMVQSIALDDLATYRQCVQDAKVDEAERQVALEKLDRIIERVRDRGIGFWEYAMATGDLDPMVEDKVITAEEWQNFASELRAAEIVLVGPPRPTFAPAEPALPAKAAPAKQ